MTLSQARKELNRAKKLAQGLKKARNLAKRIKRHEPDSIQAQVDEFLARKVKVSINHNNEAGIWQYSVQVAEGTKSDQEFWLDSFKSLKDAFAFIKEHDLPFTIIHNKEIG